MWWDPRRTEGRSCLVIALFSALVLAVALVPRPLAAAPQAESGAEPPNVEEVLDKARGLIERERLEEALALLKKVEVSSREMAAKVNVLLGSIYMRLDKPAKALGYFESAAFSTLDDSEAYLGMAEAKLALGRLVQAQRHAQTALRGDPDLVHAHLVIAAAADRGGKVDEARARLERLRRDRPESEAVAVAFATFLANRNEPGAAVQLLLGFVGRRPVAPGAHHSLGRLLWWQEQRREGVKHVLLATHQFRRQGNEYRADAIMDWLEAVDPSKRYGRKPETPEAPRPRRPDWGDVRPPKPSGPPLLHRPQPITFPSGYVVKGSGSGFVIGGGTLVVTNHHVIKGADYIMLRNGTGTIRRAVVTMVNEKEDLAVLELIPPLSENHAISFSAMVDPRPGRTAVVMGFPLPSTVGTLSPSLTEGIVSKATGFRDRPEHFLVTARSNRGNSGGPIFDHRGNIIGVVKGGLAKGMILKDEGFIPEDYTLSIKISRVLNLLNRRPSSEPGIAEEMHLEELYEVMLPKVVLIVVAVKKK